MIIKRTIEEEVNKRLFKGKIIIIYGARQVGKTTLVKEIIKKHKEKKTLYLNCDEPDIRQALTNKNSFDLKNFLGNADFVVIDEAQRVENIGLSLKLLVDNYPDIQILATGSSSFDLANKISENLTGRKYEFNLHPFSWQELNQVYSDFEKNKFLRKRLIFGSYPEIVLVEKRRILNCEQ